MPELDTQDHASGLWHAPISIVRSQMGTPDDSLLALINKIAPVSLKRDDVFVVPGIPSTTAADTYYTHMDRKTSLTRFAKQLRAGTSFLDSHDIYRLPIGSSFWGEVRDVEGGKVEGVDAEAEVFALWYMVRGHNVPGSGNTDDYIRGIESGITRKLSIGFGGPEMRIVCDEDGTDLWDWDSPFWPGKRLEDGRTTLYTVYDADLFETSQVYKNATPGALIQRWQALITDRRINPAEAERLSRMAGVRFDIPARQFIGGTAFGSGSEGVREMSKLIQALQLLPQTRAGKTLSAKNLETVQGWQSRAADQGVTASQLADDIAGFLAELEGDTTGGSNMPEQARAAVGILGENATPDKVRELLRHAEDGKAARAALVDRAVQVRTAIAGGSMTQEAQDKYRATLGKLDYAEIEDAINAMGGERKAQGNPGRNITPLRRAAGAQEDQEDDETEVYSLG